MNDYMCVADGVYMSYDGLMNGFVLKVESLEKPDLYRKLRRETDKMC